MNRFLAAIQFLTIVPVPGTAGTAESDLAGSVPAFPLVGLLIGAVLAGLAWAVAWLFPPMVAATLVVLAMAAASGGLHLDGLSDTADGFLSARPRERILQIMKDSHIGAMGAAMIAAVLLVKVAALGSLSRDALWQTAFLMPVAGRTALVVMIAVLPYARPEGGLGVVFYKTHHRWGAGWAVVVLLAAGWVVTAVPNLRSGWAGLAAAMAAIAAILLVARQCYRKIGGATGDTFGAACEIAETVVALAMAAWPQMQRHLA